MTDQLHQQLADALRSIPMADTITVMQFKQWKEALAAYEAARQEPAKRVKLPPTYRHCISGCLAGDDANGQWIRKDETIAALKAQGIEVESWKSANLILCQAVEDAHQTFASCKDGKAALEMAKERDAAMGGAQ